MKYFYNRFIKSIDMSKFLVDHEYRVLEKIIKDCIVDICFGVVVLAYYLEERSDYILYFPLFSVCCYGYYCRFKYG
jgi:hypothetical protein